MVNVGLLLKTSRSLKILWFMNRKRKKGGFILCSSKICYTIKLTSLLSVLSFLILEVPCFCQWSSKDDTTPD